MSETVTKYVEELVEIICKEYGTSDPEQDQALRDDFNEKLTASFTKFEKEIISSHDIPLNDMLNIVNKVGSNSTGTTKTGKKGGNGWTIFSGKFARANGWTRDQTSEAWHGLTPEEREQYNLEAKKLRESGGSSTTTTTTTTSTGEKSKSELWHGFQKYFTYNCKSNGVKYTPKGCSAAYQALSDVQKEQYRGWVQPE